MNDIQFNLDKDLIFFDIESTGLHVLKDRIIQIALIKYKKNGGEPEEKEYMLNPGVPISAEAMLLEEFARVGKKLDLTKRRCIDVQKIFYKMEPRTLRAALVYYCGQSLDDAHDALADVRATAEVLKGQLKKYEGVDHEDGDGFITKEPIKNNVAALAEFTTDNRSIDVTNRLKFNAEGTAVFNFGKHIGRSVADVFREDRQYYHWMMEKDFSVQVKDAIKKIMDEEVKRS